MFPTPFHFTIARGLPLAVISGSQDKVPVAPDQLVRFADLYCGPLWRQVKYQHYPLCNVAAPVP